VHKNYSETFNGISYLQSVEALRAAFLVPSDFLSLPISFLNLTQPLLLLESHLLQKACPGAAAQGFLPDELLAFIWPTVGLQDTSCLGLGPFPALLCASRKQGSLNTLIITHLFCLLKDCGVPP